MTATKSISEIQIKAIESIVEIQKSTTDAVLTILSQDISSNQSTEHLLLQTISSNQLTELTEPLPLLPLSPLSPLHPLFNDACAFCKKSGHWVQNCPTIPSQYRNCCYRCWKPENHLAKNCTSRQQKPPWLNAR